MFEFIVDLVASFISDILIPSLQNMFMDKLYPNPRINILIRLFFTLPLTLFVAFLGFSDYEAIVTHDRIFNIVVITSLLIVATYVNFKLVRKILKNQKELEN